MATWIVRLRIAENMLGLIDGLDPCQFAIGNIAPDSGIPDEKWQTFKPPVEMTHFCNQAKVKRRIKDLEYYREYLYRLNQSAENKKKYSFLLGYFFHLITDNL